jgi:dUTP pyrophosphatase
MQLQIKLRLLTPTARRPERQTDGAAGFDLFAAEEATVPGLTTTEGVGRALVRTGVALEIPPGFVGRIAARSGLSVHSNIEVGAGWVDPDYRGELRVELKNLGSNNFSVRIGDRIAQLFLLSVAAAEWIVVEDLPETSRGDGGFGSTGR